MTFPNEPQPSEPGQPPPKRLGRPSDPQSPRGGLAGPPPLPTRPEPPPPIRWWPVGVLLGLFVLAMAGRLLSDAPQRQTMVVFTLIAGLLLTLGLTLWFFFFSRFTRSAKVLGLLLAGIPLLVTFMLFELDGFSGDMVPQIKARGTEQVQMRDHNVPNGMRGEFPQFRGPERDGSLPPINLLEDWQTNPPLLAWRRPVGAAFSSFVVSETNAITMEQAGEEQALVCYDAATGDQRWRVNWPGRFQNALGGIGPRSTPTITGDAVVAIGAKGHVVCVSLKDGALRWSAELSDHGKGERRYGYAASPLILAGAPDDPSDDLVVCVAGGKAPNGQGGLLVAFQLASGDVAWTGGGSASHHYSSPLLAELAGTPQIVLFARNRILGMAIDSGTTLWEAPWPENSQCIAQPLVLPGDRVMVSSGYGVGAAVFEVSRASDGFVATEQWANIKLKAKFSSMVLHDGLVYGLDDGILVCIEPQSGERLWKNGRYGHGHLLCSGDQLIVQAESGEVVLVRLPDGIERGRFEALRRRTWNPAALAGNQLFVRNDEQAACYLLPLK